MQVARQRWLSSRNNCDFLNDAASKGKSKSKLPNFNYNELLHYKIKWLLCTYKLEIWVKSLSIKTYQPHNFIKQHTRIYPQLLYLWRQSHPADLRIVRVYSSCHLVVYQLQKSKAVRFAVSSMFNSWPKCCEKQGPVSLFSFRNCNYTLANQLSSLYPLWSRHLSKNTIESVNVSTFCILLRVLLFFKQNIF